MLYDASKHALIEDNGELVAIFSQAVRSDRAFKIADELNDWKSIPDLEFNIDALIDEKKDLEKDIDKLQDKLTDLRANFEKQESQLDEIYDAADNSDKYSKEEMIDLIKAICLRK